MIEEHKKNYVLKVCGTQEYLLDRYPICQYKVSLNCITIVVELILFNCQQYIRQCLSKGDIPQLCLVPRHQVHDSLPENFLHIPAYMRRPLPPPQPVTSLSLWELGDQRFRIHVLWATYVNVRDVDMIYVRAGLYHGQDPLCSVKDSQPVAFAYPKWHEWLEFELNLTDLPRGARLCLSICSLTKRKKREVRVLSLKKVPKISSIL